jgi:hypothetical protein
MIGNILPWLQSGERKTNTLRAMVDEKWWGLDHAPLNGG